jgi:hypothetical protein
MKLALIFAAVLAASPVLADDAGEGPATPVIPVMPAQTAWTVSPIALPAQIARAASAPLAAPAQFAVVTAGMDTAKLAQIARAASAPLAAPAQFAVVTAGMDTAKLAQAKIELFLADIEGWSMVSDFMKAPAGPKKLTGGNWLDAARDALRTKIDREGYTPEALSEAAALMQKARKGK